MRKRFYVLATRPTIGGVYESASFTFGKVRTGDAPHCVKCSKTIGMLEWLPPFSVDLRFWGKAPGDIICDRTDLLVSEKFHDGWLEDNLVGLDFIGKADVHRVIPKRMANTIPIYYVGRLQLSRTAIDDVASGLEFKVPWTCSECRAGHLLLRIKKVVINDSTWDGSDIFQARGFYGTKIVTERFRSFCEKHKLLNVGLIPCEEFSLDYTFEKR